MRYKKIIIITAIFSFILVSYLGIKYSGINFSVTSTYNHDEYENNNTPLEATELTELNNIVHANINKDSDVDIYKFDISENKCEVNITLSDIPINNNYNLALFTQENDKQITISESNWTDNLYEDISNILNPGTYYIYVYSTGIAERSSQENYKLEVDLTYLEN